IALFPPVSGGSETFPHPTYFAITPHTPDLNDLHARLTQPDVGAVVSFTGSVRGQTNREGLPAQTTYLEYEAYQAMAETKMAQIAREIWERWPSVKG
ncbi:MAG: molybdenum cofactor biosynthesis protein MoaE, partial [Anaerolineales bacterium]|nr:molybdenum cofactor biosynthesis protein MoaE [Anaerolineales bacterium]